MDDSLARALEAVRSYVAGREPLVDGLQQVAASATIALHADSSGLTLVYPDHRARTAVWTSEVGIKIDQAQYDGDRGPCLAAFRTKTRMLVDDTASDPRWPEFAACAQECGVRSSLSVPLVVGGTGIGALNLYSTRARHFTDEDADDAQVYANQAAVALANAQAYWEQAELAESLNRAMESRATIEQAKGVIMATAGVDPDEAFDLLRQQSQSENRKLRDVSAELVRLQKKPPST